MDNEYYMSICLEEAEKAFQKDEVPIGCVVVKDGEIIGRGHNTRNTNKNTLCHAELVAINMACKKLDDWRLEGCTIFVTVEPCAMCAGAIIQARINALVYGAKNYKGGCVGSVLDILDNSKFNHQVIVTSGIMEEECSQEMKKYFSIMRSKKQGY